MTYRSFPAEIVANLWGYGYFGGRTAADGPRGCAGDRLR